MTNPRKAAEIYTHTHTHTSKSLKTNFSQFILIPIFIFAPLTVFAVDINEGDSATCDTNVLNTDTGPVNLRAEYEAETIDLRWYNNNTLINVTQTQGECTYDSPITLPTDPVKPGYKFKGWKVRPQYDFSTLPTNENGMYAWSKNYDNNCWYGTFGTQRVTCDNNFNDLNSREWKAQFSFGKIYGMALCSATIGSVVGEINNQIEYNNGSYCWCKVTGYIPYGETVKRAPLSVLPWFFSNVINWVPCSDACADWCSSRIITSVDCRISGFGQTSS